MLGLTVATTIRSSAPELADRQGITGATAAIEPAPTTGPAPPDAQPAPPTTAPVAGPTPVAVPVSAGRPAPPASSTTHAPPSSTTTTTSPPTGPVFGFGLHANRQLVEGWMADSGIPWSFAYRYIGGGLDRTTGKNWTEWSPEGRFPIEYAEAVAAQGATPVLTYYSLLAASGHCPPARCGEPRADLTNLNDYGLMKRYYSDFALLMKRLGPGTWDGVAGFGGDVIVHVEPDLSGYAQNAVLDPADCFGFCTGQGNDPRHLRVAVGNSHNPEVVGLPNDFRGFNMALLRLRDRYAPNVRLAIHVSNWATNHDLNSATDPRLDAGSLGAVAGAFAAASGAAANLGDGFTSTYDLVFNDVSNRDAAFYTYVMGKPRFWDRDNVRFPNFHRWQAHLRAVAVETGKPMIVWQVPIGNQHFRTMNNSHGHYQDNRVEYFFDHVDELRAAGLVGALFGEAHDGNTVYWDKAGDGVTNGRPFCTSDGTTNAQACNDATADVADDDGGYLRLRARAYYLDPLRLRP